MNSEAWLKAQYQTVLKERDNLQLLVNSLQAENNKLRQTVFDLSAQISQQSSSYGKLKIDKVSSEKLLQDSPLRKLDHNQNLITLESELSGHNGSILAASFSKDKTYIASSGFDRIIRIWNATFPYKMHLSLSGHNQLVPVLMWGENQYVKFLFSSSYDKTVS